MTMLQLLTNLKYVQIQRSEFKAYKTRYVFECACTVSKRRAFVWFQDIVTANNEEYMMGQCKRCKTVYWLVKYPNVMESTSGKSIQKE